MGQIFGRVLDTQQNQGISDLIVVAYSMPTGYSREHLLNALKQPENLWSQLDGVRLGTAITNYEGEFNITYEPIQVDIDEGHHGNIALFVTNPEEDVFSGPNLLQIPGIRHKASSVEQYVIKIPNRVLNERISTPTFQERLIANYPGRETDILKNIDGMLVNNLKDMSVEAEVDLVEGIEHPEDLENELFDAETNLAEDAESPEEMVQNIRSKAMFVQSYRIKLPQLPNHLGLIFDTEKAQFALQNNKIQEQFDLEMIVENQKQEFNASESPITMQVEVEKKQLIIQIPRVQESPYSLSLSNETPGELYRQFVRQNSLGISLVSQMQASNINSVVNESNIRDSSSLKNIGQKRTLGDHLPPQFKRIFDKSKGKNHDD